MTATIQTKTLYHDTDRVHQQFFYDIQTHEEFLIAACFNSLQVLLLNVHVSYSLHY